MSNTKSSKRDAKLSPPHDYFSRVYWSLFVVLVFSGALWMANKPVHPKPVLPSAHVSLPVLYHNVPVYHLIGSNDVYMKSFEKNMVTNDLVPERSDLIGHYTLTPFSAGQPVHRDQIGPEADSQLISNTYAVAVPANSMTTLSDDLRAGDIVSLTVVPLSNTTSPPTVLFKEVLVLDVKPAGNQSIIILAIPSKCWLDYLTKTRNATLVLARPVG
jgi:Flp pilus assembly protein CpaB